MACPCPVPASSRDPGSSPRVPGDQQPLPRSYTLHPLGRRSCPHQEPVAQIDRSPTSSVPASCALYNQHLTPAPPLGPWAQATVRPMTPAAGSRCVYSLARPLCAPLQVDQSQMPPLSASWAFYSRDQSTSPAWEPTDHTRQSPELPVPRCYAVYSIDRNSGPDLGQNPALHLPRNYAVYSLEQTLFSHLDPSVQPGRGSCSVPVNCAVYSMDSSCSSRDALARSAPGCPLFPPLLLAVYSTDHGHFAPRLELLSQIDRSCAPPIATSCAIYSGMVRLILRLAGSANHSAWPPHLDLSSCFLQLTGLPALLS